MKRSMMKGSMTKGSMTIEMSFLMPMVLLLIMGCILAAFYYHDKNILASAAYEAAVVGSTKARIEKEEKTAETEALFYERVKGKCILLSGVSVEVQLTKQEVQITARASKGLMKVSVEKKASVTEPEDHIRDLRRLKPKE